MGPPGRARPGPEVSGMETGASRRRWSANTRELTTTTTNNQPTNNNRSLRGVRGGAEFGGSVGVPAKRPSGTACRGGRGGPRRARRTTGGEPGGDGAVKCRIVCSFSTGPGTHAAEWRTRVLRRISLCSCSMPLVLRSRIRSAGVSSSKHASVSFTLSSHAAHRGAFYPISAPAALRDKPLHLLVVVAVVVAVGGCCWLFVVGSW